MEWWWGLRGGSCRGPTNLLSLADKPKVTASAMTTAILKHDDPQPTGIFSLMRVQEFFLVLLQYHQKRDCISD